MTYRASKIAISMIILTASLTPMAADKHKHHKPGMTHDATASANGSLTESGQSTFATLIELVDRLERNPGTNWSAINIDNLHAHLVQMNLLMLQTSATTESTASTIRYDVTPKNNTHSDVTSAIQTMALAHAGFVAHSRGWKIDATETEFGASVTINTDDQALRQKLTALGFYGFMSLDSHHQAHHWAMATGGAPHGH